MSPHARIVSHLREQLTKDGHDMRKHLDGFTDEQVFHKIFHSYRGKGEILKKGMRLSWLGYTLVGLYFKAYEVTMPENYRLGLRDLLYLDSRSKMPYYIGRGEDEDGGTILAVFEAKLGIMLKLADGMISNLREMES